MPRYVALLRGINVGGKTLMKMDELRKTFEALPFSNVKTYINSGNVGFDADSADECDLVSRIEHAIETDFGRPVPVMVRECDDIRRILSSNPFEGRFESHKEMHVLFLKEPMPSEKLRQLTEATPDGEHYAALGREVYCHLPAGISDSLVGKGFIERKLKVPTSGRNWRTVEKLAEL